MKLPSLCNFCHTFILKCLTPLLHFILFELTLLFHYHGPWVLNQPVYGFASGDPLRFKRAVGHKDLFYLDDREVDFKEVVALLMIIKFSYHLFQNHSFEMFLPGSCHADY